MKRIILTAGVVLAIAQAGVSLAQVRHDDKPHGPSARPAEETMMAEPRIHPGGRHDAQSHKIAITTHNRALARKKAAEQAKAAAASATPVDGASK